MPNYNPWPLGKLPEEWQRPEPAEIKRRGYDWDDARDINGMFEERLAEYAGSRFAVLTDCCTNALFLSLKYLLDVGEIHLGDLVEIPDRTYLSVPQVIQYAGLTPRLVDSRWMGQYSLGSTRVIDSAGRFSEGMFEEGSAELRCLSFQIKKRLPIGRGGAILTDDANVASSLRRMAYDGRDLNTPYDSPSHFRSMGWHMYMTPEDAARGLLLLEALPRKNEDTMGSDNYPPISRYEGTPRGWFE